MNNAIFEIQNCTSNSLCQYAATNNIQKWGQSNEINRQRLNTTQNTGQKCFRSKLWDQPWKSQEKGTILGPFLTFFFTTLRDVCWMFSLGFVTGTTGVDYGRLQRDTRHITCTFAVQSMGTIEYLGGRTHYQRQAELDCIQLSYGTKVL